MRLVGKVYCISFIDIRRAHFVRPATRELYVELPTEAQTPGVDLVGFMLQSMYGTRDASANWNHAKQVFMVSKGVALRAVIGTRRATGRLSRIQI